MTRRNSHLLRLLCTGILSVGFMAAQAQQPEETPAPDNQLDVDLQFFTRGEIRSGALPSSTGSENSEDQSKFILGRTRLIIDYKKSFLEAKVNMQHSGVWGQSGKGAFNLYEAWAKLNAPNGLFLQVGRQALAYDDERIIGLNDWAMAGMSHDVIRAGYEGHGHKVHAIYAFNQNAENMTNGSTYYVNGAQPYKTMQTLWYNYTFRPIPLTASLLFMNIGMQMPEEIKEPKTKYQQLIGTYIAYQPKHWTVKGSYYHQMGRDEMGSKLDAWMANIKVDYLPADNYGFTAGYDYLSGDENFAVPQGGMIGMTYHKVLNGFNPVYGSHHKFYGAMDFFYVSTYVNGFTPGLQNLFVGGMWKPIPKLTFSAKYHYFATASKLKDVDKTLGHEIEVQASYRPLREVNLSAGYSFMAGTKTMEFLKRANDQGNLRWLWLSLSISPRIFSVKW